MGLANLRGRVEAMGGRFDLQSARGEGTTVRMVLPL
jgi:signal transduction histidine kinase